MSPPATIPAGPTSPSPDLLADGPASIAPALGGRAAAGFLWMSVQSLFTRALTFGGQLVLAAVLLPHDFGLSALAATAAMIASFVQQIGIREVLIARGRKFHLWENVGFWICLAFGALAGGLIALSAPAAAWLFREPDLVGLILVLAATAPLTNLTIVHEAKLQSQMRFRSLAGLNLVQGALNPICAVALALLGAGAYSFVLSRLAVAIARTLYLLPLVRVAVRPRLDLRRWAALLRPSTLIFATNVLGMLGAAVPAGILGLVTGSSSVGYFAFAMNIAVQGVLMLGTSLDSVLFPTLGRLVREPARLRAAFIRAARTLAATITPVCLGQAVIAGPLLALFFDQKWAAAVRSLEILSVGMIFFALFIPAGSLLQALGRFRERLVVMLVWTLFALAAQILGAWLAGAEGVAAAIGATYLLSSLHNTHLAIHSTDIAGERKKSWASVGSIFIHPLVIGAAAAVAAVAVREVIGWNPLSSPRATAAAQVLGAGGAFTIIYTLLLRIAMPDTWGELLATARRLRRPTNNL